MRDETTFNFSGPFRDVMPLYVQLHGKGDKSRIVPINARVASVTQKYIKRYGRIQPDALVFTNRTGGKLTRAGVQYIIDKVEGEKQQAAREGEKRGAVKAKIETVQRLHEMGIGVQDIAKASQVPVETVKQWLDMISKT